jgi:predicted phosphodiesterase
MTDHPAKSPTSHTPRRYAHPFFAQAAPPPGTASSFAKPQSGLTDWSKLQLGPIPPVRNNGHMALADVIGAEGAGEIDQLGEIRFHALGDSGVGDGKDAEAVAEEMASDFKPSAGGLNPAFLLHLGDVVYGPGKQDHYGERFYGPYRHYQGKILAIPGNHDGEVKSQADAPSLSAFLANFCAKEAAVPPQASGSGIFRETMTQPGAYWVLDAPFVRIIGLYSNMLENPGFLQGKTPNGDTDTSQLDWLKATLQDISKLKQKKALVIATHHPPYSQSGHSGSTEMMHSIDEICSATGVYPDAFFSGHAHNYQRYLRRIGGKQIPYYVIGTGGISTQKTPPATGQPTDDSNQATYDAALQSMGYLFVTCSATQLKTEFWRLGDEHTLPFDPVTIDLTTHAMK